MAYSLTGRSILIISPQVWGDMRVSKHHYATELAKRGNQVFFLNPPDPDSRRWFSVEKSQEWSGLSIVTYRPFFPLMLRFHARWLYDRLMSLQLRALRRRIGRLDVVWNFDFNSYATVDEFGPDKVVYHVVDDIAESRSVKPAHDADLVISVAPEILDRFIATPARRLLINHGLGEEFSRPARRRLTEGALEPTVSPRPRIGYVGNLLRPSVDRPVLQALIASQSGVEFHFWGGGGEKTDDELIRFLRASANVTLHGAKPPGILAEEMQEMDAFLICYAWYRDANSGYNTHKILEYLSTGKVVVSSRITAYEKHRNLIQMSLREDNSDLVELLEDTIRRLSVLNGADLQRRRLKMALDNSYAAHVEQIEAALG